MNRWPLLVAKGGSSTWQKNHHILRLHSDNRSKRPYINSSVNSVGPYPVTISVHHSRDTGGLAASVLVRHRAYESRTTAVALKSRIGTFTR
jgi:hypothetical protein